LQFVMKIPISFLEKKTMIFNDFLSGSNRTHEPKKRTNKFPEVFTLKKPWGNTAS
jgi:hypothetical protein